MFNIANLTENCLEFAPLNATIVTQKEPDLNNKNVVKVQWGKFHPTNKRNPCPVCSDGKGKCRTTDGDLILCMTHDTPLPGWHYLGQTKDYLWGKFLPEGDRPAPVAKVKKEREPDKAIVSAEKKDANYRSILEQLELSDRHINDFQRRNLQQPEIQFLETIARSLPNGYLIPFPNAEGQFTGAQTRRDEADGGRYRWHYIRNDWSLNNGFDEKPLAVWKNGNPIWIIEGTGVKPIVASIRHGITAIGAAGGQHYLSPKTLLDTLEKLGNPDQVVFCPDAGDIHNPQVLRRIEQNIEFLESLGRQVTIAWWGQFSKDDQDVDDLPSLDNVQYLTPQEFWNLARPEFRPVTTKPKSKAQKKREWRNIQADITRNSILNPFGNRPYDVVCSTKEKLDQALRDHPYAFIDGPTASGKTESLRVLLQDEVNHIGFTPLRSLARGAAAALNLPYWNESKGGVITGAVACIHSALSVANARKTYDRTYLYLDEVEQCLEALLQSELCREHRSARIEALRELAVNSDRIVAASATANRKDLDYLEAITGKRFTLIRFNPQLHQKGDFTIYTSLEDVRGSDRAAKDYVRSLSGEHTYVATDSYNESIRFGLLAEKAQIEHMLINRRTATEDDEVQRLLSSASPGQHWKDHGYSTLIASPTVQSGFSIKGGCFDQVLGLFSGKSIPPASCVQSVERDRSSVSRIVYAPRYSSPPDKLGTGYAPKGVGKFRERQAKQWELEADHLQNTVSTGAFTGFKFLGGAEREWYREWEIQRNREFSNFAVAVEAYATRQGFTVGYAIPPESLLSDSMKDEVNDRKASPIVVRGNANPLHKEEVRDILAETKEPKQEDLDRIEAYLIRDYFGLAWNAPLSKENVINEGFGDGRKALRQALRILWDGQAEADDQARRDKLGGEGYLWDSTNYALTLKWWDKLGIDEVLAHCLSSPYSSNSPEIQSFSDRLAIHQDELGEGSRLLGVKVPWRGDDIQDHYGKVVKWIGMMLKRLGIETESKRNRDESGNVQSRTYTVTPESVERLKIAIGHKHQKQINQGFTPRSTPLWKIFHSGVDQGNYFVLWEEYSRAMALDDLELATQLAAHLDKFQEF